MFGTVTGGMGYYFYDGVEAPLSAWSYGLTHNRSMYKTADSNGCPTRVSETLNGTLVLTGIEYSPPFVPDLGTQALNFVLGINGKEIPFIGWATIFEVRYNYVRKTFGWSLTLEQASPGEMEVASYYPQYDNTVCSDKLCGYNITTSDVSLHGGYVYYVKEAVCRNLYELPSYRTAVSYGFPASHKSTFDQRISMVVEGDLDYWLSEAYTSNKYDYKFYYSSTGYYQFDSQVVESIVDLNVNVSTDQIVSATINLGIAR